MKVFLLTALLLVAAIVGPVTQVQAQNVNNPSGTLDAARDRQELRDLIDAYAYLGDEKKTHQQMALFTPSATYKVYMNGTLVANTKGTDLLEKEFSAHAAQVKTYFTLNGQHTVKINGDAATGISFSQIKMVRKSADKDALTDYSVRYEDKYVRQGGKWLIEERTGYFVIVEARPLGN